MKNQFNALLFVGKVAYAAGMLLLFNFFFGLLFFSFMYWLMIGGVFLVVFIIALSFGKKILLNPFVRQRPASRHTSGGGDIIDVEAEVLDEEAPQPSGSAQWHDPVSCPKCYSKDTRFIEPRYEAGVYECNNCRVRFEAQG